MNGILESIQTFGPVFAAVWIITILCIATRPQRYLNSFLLIFALLVSMIFLASFFGEFAGTFLLICFLLVMLALFAVPVLLILNGVRMIRRESPTPAHLLSLVLGIVIGIGEIATVVYVFGLSDSWQIENANIWVLWIAFTVFYFSCLILSFVIYTVFIQIMPHRMNFNYIIIHGCGLREGSKLTKLLQDRVDKAIFVYRKCRGRAVIIPSGGRGDDEKVSEAQAMTEYLVGCGIPEDHIIPEDRSATTAENLRYSKEIIDARPGKKKTALISSNYHIYRCLRLARAEGLTCTGIGAHVTPYYWPSALIREFIAIFLTKRFLIWSLAGYLLFIIPPILLNLK